MPNAEVPDKQHGRVGFTDAFFQDTQAEYARLRALHGPVAVVPSPAGGRAWLVLGYPEVRAALADKRLLKDPRKQPWWQNLWSDSAVFDPLNTNLLTLDPPDHERLRKLVTKAFTARRVEQLRPRVQEITTALLDAMEPGTCGLRTRREGETDPHPQQNDRVVDLISEFAFPLPITVICELLGIPSQDRDTFRSWSNVVFSADTTTTEMREATAHVSRYFVELIEVKRRNPADDLVSALIQAHDADDRLNEAELLGMIFMLMTAGHETTTNLIAGGILALLRNPAEKKRLAVNPSLLPSVIDELFRYSAVANFASFRFAAEQIDIGGTIIPAGGEVIIALASANHDAERFSCPAVLDFDRDASGHLTFGNGIHYCLGASLARLEAEIAFASLLGRFPGMNLAVSEDSLRWRPVTLVRCLEALPVRLT